MGDNCTADDMDCFASVNQKEKENSNNTRKQEAAKVSIHAI
jgi:hypothetical protein